jgi:hypothetical protein
MSTRRKTTTAPRLPKGGHWLQLDKAVLLMHRPESRMAKMNTPVGPQWLVIARDGGYVKPEDAIKIIARPDIVGMEDALWPGLDQTYRMVRG